MVLKLTDIQQEGGRRHILIAISLIRFDTVSVECRVLICRFYYYIKPFATSIVSGNMRFTRIVQGLHLLVTAFDVVFRARFALQKKFKGLSLRGGYLVFNSLNNFNDFMKSANLKTNNSFQLIFKCTESILQIAVLVQAPFLVSEFPRCGWFTLFCHKSFHFELLIKGNIFYERFANDKNLSHNSNYSFKIIVKVLVAFSTNHNFFWFHFF